MSVFLVTQNANKVSGIYTRPYLVRNGGAETIYLGQDSSLTPGTQSISMPSGSTLNWSGDTELWACTDVGKTSNLEVLYTGDSAFTPGPDVVSANILQNAEIIVSGTITIQPGVPKVIPFDIDTSSYASVVIQLHSNSSLPSPPVDLEQIVRIDYGWDALTGINIRRVAQSTAYISPWSDMEQCLTVSGDALAIHFTSSPTVQPNLRIDYTVVGLTAPRDEYYKHVWDWTFTQPKTSGFTSINRQQFDEQYMYLNAAITRLVAGDSEAFAYPDTYSGKATLSEGHCDTFPAPAGGTGFVVISPLSGFPSGAQPSLYRQTFTTTGEWVLKDFWIPRRPVFLRFVNRQVGAVAGTMQYVLSMVYNGVNAER